MPGETDNKSRKIKELRARIARLNGKPLEQQPDTSDTVSLRQKLNKRKLRLETEPENAPDAAAPPDDTKSDQFSDNAYRKRIALETVVSGEEITSSSGAGSMYHIRTPADGFQNGSSICSRYRSALDSPESGISQRLNAIGGSHDIVFFDLETTGLGSSPLFLIGAMNLEDNRLVVRQYFARDYSEERAVIHEFLERYREYTTLISFNGKSYDYPYLRTRAAANGIPFTWVPSHLDLLHACRSVWRGVLPNCKLQTLEAMVCRRPRAGDIPGREIPDAYHAFVHSGDAWQIGDIIQHNALDLITLADLAARLPGNAD